MDSKSRNESNGKILNRRPEARGFRVEQLLQEAADGRLRIPSFQRPLRWKSKQVIEYFDSIRRGFPVGDLLLSRDYAPKELLHFGPREIDATEQHSALWVIDGQQRITALVACLLRLETIPKGDYWAIWYDLEKEEFSRLNRKVAPPDWIPLNVLCNSVSLLKWIRIWPHGNDNPELVDRALELGKAIREYEVPAYIVDSADEGLLRLIFTRVNTAGIGMRESEIFEARYGREGDKPIRTAVARLTDLGFGEIDEELFLRCLRSICGITVNVAVGSPEVLAGDSIRRTERAIRRAVYAIRNSAGIPHWKLLPYRLPLIFLSAFFDRFLGDDSRVDRLAAKWIWQGALSGDHQDVTDAKINRLLKQTKGFEKPDEALASLLRLVSFDQLKAFPNLPAAEFDRAISMNRASGKIFILGLIGANPRSLNQEIQMELDFEEHADEATVTPASEELDLKKLLVALVGKEKRGTDVVIRTENLKQDDFSNQQTSDEFLSSHILDANSIELLRTAKIDDFRIHRRSLLTAYFDLFVKDRMGDSVDLRPSILSIVSESSKSIAAEAVPQ